MSTKDFFHKENRDLSEIKVGDIVVVEDYNYNPYKIVYEDGPTGYGYMSLRTAKASKHIKLSDLIKQHKFK